ncbi:MAG TPA: hypothetical protein VN634_18515 [Candidatus Limnocylindrales bacterium]|nr:hypothetical protein [Candidatus Limnocylindrales bacterium]
MEAPVPNALPLLSDPGESRAESVQAALVRNLSAPPVQDTSIAAVWELSALAGRLVEITGGSVSMPATSMASSSNASAGEPRTRATSIWDIDESRRYGSAALTVAAGLVWKAQQLGEPVAWINVRSSSFFPPDLDAAGIDLAALVVVRINSNRPDGLTDARAAARAADKLLRSGAFGLVILDLGAQADVPSPLLSRLLGLAQKHHAAVVFLTERSADSSLAPIVSLRVAASRRQLGAGRFACTIEARKDKRRAPGWTHEETFRGPPGLR